MIGLQFFRGKAPEVRSDNPNDLLLNNDVPAAVEGIMRSACYDCHSMETNYPWYSYITPFSWLIIDHIVEGRDELNFSEWNTFEKRRKIRKLKEIGEEIEEGEMPMESYVYLHGDARLTEDQRALLINWADEFATEVMKE